MHLILVLAIAVLSATAVSPAVGAGGAAIALAPANPQPGAIAHGVAGDDSPPTTADAPVTVFFSPEHPAPGGALLVTGTGCQPNEAMFVNTWGLAGGDVIQEPGTANADGEFEVITAIPADVAPGEQFGVRANCSDVPLGGFAEAFGTAGPPDDVVTPTVAPTVTTTGPSLPLAAPTTAAPTTIGPPPPEAIACSAVPAGLTLLVPHEGGLASVNATGADPVDVLLTAAPAKGVRGADGTLWVELLLGDDPTEVYRQPPGGSPTLSAQGQVAVTGVGEIDGATAAVIVDHTPEPGVELSGSVLVEFADGSTIDVKDAAGPEYGVASVTVGPGRLVEGAGADLTEVFSFYGTDAVELTDWPDPTETAAYNAPPLYQWPIAADAGDGPVLSWLEGPDVDGATQQFVGTWELVVADAPTGAELLRLDLGLALGDHVHHADFDGRFWVATTTPAAAGDDRATALESSDVLVVDTLADAPAVVHAGCAGGGVATIDRMPPGDPATDPPAGCDGYVDNDQYPIRRCDRGPAVSLIQQALVDAGHDVAIDGYFGPQTEAAVRAFQAANGLAVDGLVGAVTWAALVPAADGTDADGSGTVDPDELA